MNINSQLIDLFEQTEEEKLIEENSLLLVSLIKKAGCYTQIINGKECMSLVSGLMIQDMISNSGCSMEKIPIIIGQVKVSSISILHLYCDFRIFSAFSITPFIKYVIQE